MKFLKSQKVLMGMLVDKSDMKPLLKELVAKKCMHTISASMTSQEASNFVMNSLNNEVSPGWICVVGESFACNIEHEPGTFSKLQKDSKYFVIYKPTQFTVTKSEAEEPENT